MPRWHEQNYPFGRSPEKKKVNAQIMPIAIISSLVIVLIALIYSCFRIYTLLPFSRPYRIITLLVWVAIPSSLLLRLMGDSLPLGLMDLTYTLGTAWIFVLLYFVLLSLLLEPVRLWIPSARPYLKHNWKGTLFVAALLIGIFTYGHAKYRDKERIALSIAIEKTTPPLKIVGLSDLHLGYTIEKEELAQWVNWINAEKPDLILIAGDIVDGDTRPLLEDGVAQELQRLQAPLGVYACLGNHEYMGGEGQERRFLAQTGITLLQDSVAEVEGIYIIGRDDKSNSHRKNLSELTASLDPEKPKILLDHQPYNLHEAEENGIDFQLSGHTHRGQVFPINLIVDRMYEKAHGYHRRGKTHYYVSSGMGIWGGKFRLGTQSEYVVVHLQGKSAEQ